MKTKKILSCVLALIMMLGCAVISVSAKVENTANLDADTNTSKDVSQNYTFTQASAEYTDVTKVKIEWVVSDVSASYKSDKTWNPETMTWEEKSKSNVTATVGSVSFTATNYSSKNIVATVEFKAETAVAATLDKITYTNNGCTVKTPVVKDDTTTYDDDDFTALKETITASLSFDKDAFEKLSKTTSATKYGTYTITIEGAKTATVATGSNCCSVMTVESNDLVLNIGDSWTDAITANSGKTIVINAGETGDITTYTCTVGKDKIGGVEYACVIASYTDKYGDEDTESFYIYTTSDPNALTYENFTDYLIPATGTVPETVNIYFIGF